MDVMMHLFVSIAHAHTDVLARARTNIKARADGLNVECR